MASNLLAKKSEFEAARPHNFAPVINSDLIQKFKGPLKLCSVDINERRQEIRRLDLLVRFGSSQNEHK